MSLCTFLDYSLAVFKSTEFQNAFPSRGFSHSRCLVLCLIQGTATPAAGTTGKAGCKAGPGLGGQAGCCSSRQTQDSLAPTVAQHRAAHLSSSTLGNHCDLLFALGMMWEGTSGHEVHATMMHTCLIEQIVIFCTS